MVPEKHKYTFSDWFRRSVPRTESFTPDRLYLKGPEFDELPLEVDLDRNTHRTTATHSFSRRIVSCDNFHKRYRSDNGFAIPNGSLLQHNAASDDEPPNHDTLCSKCQVINIEFISTEGGYSHSILLNIMGSTPTCRLCQVLLDAQEGKLKEWTLDRYEVVISLQSKAEAKYSTDHFVTRGCQ